MTGPLSRRSFLLVSAGGLLAACSKGSSTAPPTTTAAVGTAPLDTTPASLPPAPSITADPFTLGVASGDPTADSVILWTRLTPDPASPAGGLGPEPVTIGWQVGADDTLSEVVASGEAVADAAFGHSVHVELQGLDPARTYWYRFFVGDYESEIGRTRTAPAPDEMASRLVLAQISCQRWSEGYWTAFDDLATHDLDLVLHCGDYIYERNFDGVRPLELPEPTDLDGYRLVYATYKHDPSLRAAHAVAPWVVTWDDHEVENNYQGDTPTENSDTPDREGFLARRAAAYQAWWEHMPVRLPAPTGASWPIHRAVDYGRLMSLSVLDTRQYRTNQACSPSDIGPRCDGAEADDYTVLGAEQEAWLSTRFDEADARYTVLLQQIVMQQWRFLPGDTLWNLDQWDGYPAARRRLLGDLQRSQARNPIVLTGDVHSSWVGSLVSDFDDPDAAVIGTEFVGTSVSSEGDLIKEVIPVVTPQSPHIAWAQAEHRGWTRHDVTPQEWRAEFREVADALVEGSPVEVSTTWVVPDGGVVTQV
ncbi:MAG: alkaline phosphatase D family protein [Acidimicrobiales bacterium]